MTGHAAASDARPVHILGLGVVVVDHQVFMDDIPERDTKTTIHSDRYQIGGPVPTALALLRRLGHRCGFIGRWGADPMGAMVEVDLDREGIDRSHSIVEADARTGFAHVWVDRHSGARSVAAYRGGAPVLPEELPRHLEPPPVLLHLDGWHTEAAIALARRLKTGSCLVSLDLGSPKPHPERLLACVDYANIPVRCLEQLFPNRDRFEAAREILDLGPDRLTVTDGANGVHLFRKDGPPIHQPAVPVEAVDTNGAGDVFTGAMIHAMLENLSPNESLAFAAAASAIKCGRTGNREALPDLREVETFLGNRDEEKESAPPNNPTV